MDDDDDRKPMWLELMWNRLTLQRGIRNSQERRQWCREVPKMLLNRQEGRVQHLRSLNNNEKSFVRFRNRTNRNVELYWIDYRGQALSFGTLPVGESVDMDTFVTHPWIFVDEENGDRYVVKQKDVFFPEAYRKSNKPARTLVFIEVPIYTLEELALRVIIRHLRHPQHIHRLEIPTVLKAEMELRVKLCQKMCKDPSRRG
ncbi:von Hippel-Lindau tumor suppressor homolog [Halictus rubicundus]|uniref:von Hippel-Lindau tumor suppressor homolog n=1 Tax=Halictus rubicundus TaxID=77578 RepID=UPI004036F781